MMLFIVAPLAARVVAGPDCRPQFRPGEVEAAVAQHPGCLPFVRSDLPTWPDSLDAWQVTVEQVVPEAPEGEEPPPPVRVVTAVEPDPDWTPPEPAPDPVQARLEALEAAVARQEQAVAANILASPHDRRWLVQKERAKLFGIGWIKANPEAGQADLEAAVMADLAQQFPGEPLVVSGGVVLSYAVEAAARGYIPDGSYESLRALVAAASADQLQAMLAAL